VKSLKKQALSADARAELKNEVEIYLSLDHPHIARLEYVYETLEEIHLVMEYMRGGEVYDRLTRSKRYSEQAAADTLHSMMLAVAYLHAHNICHRDLKLENFLYETNDSDHLKLIDFGLAAFRPDETKLRQRCGSIHYVAPEVLAKSYTEQADMWSMGVISHMLLTGTSVFKGGTNTEIFQSIRAGRIVYSSKFHRLSSLAQDFVKSLLVIDPAKRLTAQGAMQHAFVAKRHKSEAAIDTGTLGSLRSYAQASHFRRACLSMMAWSLSREDRQDLRKQFLELDVERKGTISLSQFKSVLEQNFHVGSVEAEKIFASLDMNHDKELCYSEFLAATLQDRIRMHEHVLRKTFSRFDRNELGAITVESLRSLLGDTFEDVKVEELLREADVDGNGSISFEEFQRYLLHPELDTPPDSDREETKVEKGRAPAKLRKQQCDLADALIDVAIDPHAKISQRQDYRSSAVMYRLHPKGALDFAVFI
jgi:calcium-dependent protein kinase